MEDRLPGVAWGPKSFCHGVRPMSVPVALVSGPLGSGCLTLQSKVGGKLHARLNTPGI